ncbi:uncharacterized protein N7483_000820 [Penicillium malachiteum]|uniref:uncharacterized protein n=1 Tax=Penicillium malachiteum TaxID=1324776 RepID=UPI002549BC05|nr:uncharacterized protein N7483_000820 [Penicillium malachiteum]KAJ5735695.1 hypothetical protein N7483_000820 [Penicillium malachiteum]
MFLTFQLVEGILVEVPPEGAMAPPPRPPPRPRPLTAAAAATAAAVALAAVGPADTWRAPRQDAVGLSPRTDLKECSKCGHFLDLTHFVHAVRSSLVTEQCDNCRAISNRAHAAHPPAHRRR